MSIIKPATLRNQKCGARNGAGVPLIWTLLHPELSSKGANSIPACAPVIEWNPNQRRNGPAKGMRRSSQNWRMKSLPATIFRFLFDNYLIALRAMQWLAAGEFVDKQESVERTVWNGHLRGERPGGFAGLGHGGCEAQRPHGFDLVRRDMMKGIDRRLEPLLGLLRQHARGENQPVHAVRFEPDHRETEFPFAGACGGGHRRHRVDFGRFARTVDQAVDPTAGPIGRKRRLRWLVDAVEAQGFGTAGLDAEKGLGGVFENKPFGSEKGKTEPPVQELAAADRPFGGIVAKGHAVDRGEIGCPAGRADARGADLARGVDRLRDPLRGGGVRRQKIRRAGARRVAHERAG